MDKTIAISQFKSHCLEIIDRLQVSRESIIITKRDKPIARIEAIPTNKASLFGIFKDKAEIPGDVIDPIDVK